MVDESIYDPIRPDRPVDEKVLATIQSRRQKKAQLAEVKRDYLVTLAQSLYY